jgi:DNA uptake protein ComE-like DNA-binding protein
MSQPPNETDLKIREAFVASCTPTYIFWTTPEIPTQKIAVAQKHFLFLRDELLLGLADETTWGTMKEGFALTTRRIYWKNPRGSAHSLPYTELSAHLCINGSKLALDSSSSLSITKNVGRTQIQLLEFLHKARVIAAQLEPPYDPGLPSRLTRICAQSQDDAFYVGAFIPSSHVANARQNLHIPSTSHLLALLDTTLIGGAGRGMAFCNDGLRWSEFNSNGFVPWDVFPQMEVKFHGDSDIKIGDFSPFPGKIGMLRTTLVRVLQELQEEIRSSGAATQTNATPLSAPVTGNSYSSPPQQARLPILSDSPKIQTKPKPKKLLPVVDINNATPLELLALPGVDKAGAEKIRQQREFRAGFESAEEIGQLLQLQPHQVQRLKERIEILPIAGAKPVPSTRRRVVEF